MWKIDSMYKSDYDSAFPIVSDTFRVACYIKVVMVACSVAVFILRYLQSACF